MKKNFAVILVIGVLFLLSCTQPVVNDNAANPENARNVDMIINGNANAAEVSTETVNYGPANGFLAMPKEEGEYPAIVMIHEWWGINDNIKQMAAELAKEGYVVLAVDLYGGRSASNSTEAGALAGEARSNLQKAVSNMQSAVSFLKSHEKVDQNKIASLGWCFGGMMSLQLALSGPLNATVIYYGNLETNASRLSVIKWPVLGIFGEEDQSIPVASVLQFQEALNDIGIENEIYIYPGVGHAFANPSGMNYAKEETKDAWAKTIDFLDRHLKK